MCSSSMAAMERLRLSLLALDRAGRQARDDPALEDEYEDDDRNGHHTRRGGDVAGRRGELRLAGEERDRGRDRARVVRRGERDREDEVVPREDEDEDRGREHARRG